MKNNAGLDVILYLCHKGDIFSPKNNKQHYFNIMAKEVEAKATDTGAAKLKALQATIDKIEKDYGKGTIMKLVEPISDGTRINSRLIRISGNAAIFIFFR